MTIVSIVKFGYSVQFWFEEWILNWTRYAGEHIPISDCIHSCLETIWIQKCCW